MKKLARPIVTTNSYSLEDCRGTVGIEMHWRWTSQDAMDLQVPVPTIDIAVSARKTPLCKDGRFYASKLFGSQARISSNNQAFLLNFTKRILYKCADYLRARFFAVGYFLNITNTILIWKLLRGFGVALHYWSETFRAFQVSLSRYRALSSLPLDSYIAKEVSKRNDDLREVISVAVRVGIPVPAFLSSLSFFDSLRSEWFPANLIQALRDDFGAHTYERIDERGKFHTQWTETMGGFSSPV